MNGRDLALLPRSLQERALAKVHPAQESYDAEAGPNAWAMPRKETAHAAEATSTHVAVNLPKYYYIVAAVLVTILLSLTIYFVAPHQSDEKRLLSPVASFSDLAAFTGVSRDRVYFLSAEEVEWDYAPLGKNNCSSTGELIDPEFIGPFKGTKFTKWVFREYTDKTFTTVKPHEAKWQHLGILGPALIGEVGDVITIHLRNAINAPINLVPTGVAATGAFGAITEDWHINRGDSISTRWLVTPAAGPGPGDPSSRMWIYRSTFRDVETTHAGLLGTIVITANAMSNFDGNPIDAEQTVVTLMHTFDEAQSPLLYDNIQKYGTRDLIDAVAAMGVADQASLSAALAVAGGLEAVDPATALALKKHTVNGMSFCNLPGISLSEGVSFRWHIAAPGSEIHAPHWHGNTVREDVHQEDQAGLMPGVSLSFDGNPDSPGTWLLECGVGDVGKGGMKALYTVAPSTANLTAEFTGREPLPNENGVLREYFLASEEVLWDYAPSGSNLCTSPATPFASGPLTKALASVNVTGGALGRAFRKVVYVQYADANFTTRVVRPPEQAYLGMMGPIMRAEVGDIVRITYRNKASIATTMHVHGLLYRKSSEGASYADGFKDSPQDAVPPNTTVVFEWGVPKRSGPGEGDLSSSACMYHGNVNSSEAGVNTGMFGVIIVTAKGMADRTGAPTDTDLEIVTVGTVIDEAKSSLWRRNIAEIAEASRVNLTADDALEAIANSTEAEFYTLNGYTYCNAPDITIRQGQIVRWHVVGFGQSQTAGHSFGLEGATVLTGEGELQPGFGVMAGTGDAMSLVATTAGRFRYGCKTESHEVAGMQTWVTVTSGSLPTGTPEELRQARSWTYYLAAEPFEHDFAPFGYDNCRGRAYDLEQQLAVGPAPVNGSLGSAVTKGRFVLYNTSAFDTPVPRDVHLGIVGPLLHARDGDTVTIVLRNNLPFAINFDIVGLPSPRASAALVQQGSTQSFVFDIPQFPAIFQSSDIVNSTAFIYRSTPAVENTWAPGTPVTAAATGLTGLIVVDSLEEAKTAEGLPQDIDVEYPLLFEAIDEAQSAFFPQNVLRHGLNGPANAGRLAAMASDPAVIAAASKSSVNGFQFCNGPVYSLRAGTRVRWYIYGTGAEQVNVDGVTKHGSHTVVFSGQVVSRFGSRQTAVPVTPGTVTVVDMFAGTVGKWLARCGVDYHVAAGMAARIDVTPVQTAPIIHNNDGTVNLVQLQIDSVL